MLYHSILLDKLTVPGNVFLAPMAGFSDRAFRQICFEKGCCLSFSEMVSAEALVHESLRSADLMKPFDNEELLAIQLFSGNEVSVAGAIPWVLEFKPSIIDLNCGCPVPKIIKSGAGSALLKTPEKIYKIIKAIKDQTDLPVTAKIRSGWDASSINYLETAAAAIEAGAAMISLHPRTKKQGYSGLSKWEHIKELKKAVSVPVCGSGDLFSALDIKRMLEETGCDAVMAARGVQGNPFLFNEAKQVLKGLPITQVSPLDKIETGLRQLKLCAYYEGEDIAVKEMKKQLCSYTKGLAGSGELRGKLVRTTTIKDQIFLLKSFIENYNST